jgi:hypothetical protein
MSASPGANWKPILAIAVIALAALVVFHPRGDSSAHVEATKQSRISAASIERVK